MPTRPLRLALGPILYHWPRPAILDFYERIADCPVDIVYLGETVCAKRRALRPEDWLELAAAMQERGKEVVISTLALIEAGSELATVRRFCANGRFTVEANDMASVNILAGLRVPFVAGPSVNVYNARALAVLARLGLRRWVLPVELSRDALADIQAARPETVETEVFGYGRLPLAYSARCYTARARSLPKDRCAQVCGDDPDGLLLSTQEDEPFLVLNGVQTQSARTFTLLDELETLRALKVEVLRISPQSRHTDQVIALFDHCRRSGPSTRDPSTALNALMPTGPCSGYWYGDAGLSPGRARLDAVDRETPDA